jgi:putative ABC transport system permease protein
LVVSEILARKLFGDEDPIGRRITIFRQASVDPDYGEPVTGEIVGVAANTRTTMRALQPTPAVYVPHEIHTWPTAYLAVRAREGETAVAEAVRSIVTTVDARIPVAGVTSLDALAQFALGRDRFLTAFAIVFSIVAGLLALVGVYGALSYAVRRRSRDLGIRLALGATKSRVLRHVFCRAAIVVGVGGFLGGAGALVVTRFMASVLFETSPTDPVVLGASVLAALVLGSVGAWAPAYRAARTDPMTVLREE